MTSPSGKGQTCAACKYQRRRCTTECLLAPYFPADQPKIFQNAHKLFGVSNIKKILEHLSLDKRNIAVKTIKYVANMWDKYPVHGPLVEIHRLIYNIQMAEEELQATLAQVTHYRDMSHGIDPLQAAVTLFPVTPHVSYSNHFYDFSENYSGHNENSAVSSLWLQQMRNGSDSNMPTSTPMSIQQKNISIDKNSYMPPTPEWNHHNMEQEIIN